MLQNIGMLRKFNIVHRNIFSLSRLNTYKVGEGVVLKSCRFNNYVGLPSVFFKLNSLPGNILDSLRFCDLKQ